MKFIFEDINKAGLGKFSSGRLAKISAKQITRTLNKVFLSILMWTSVLLLLFPFLWMLSTSLKPTEETFQAPPTWFPKNPTLSAFRDIWIIRPFGHYILNGFIVGLGATILSIGVASLAAYAFARFRFRGKQVSLLMLLATQMIPYVMIAIPLYVMFSKIGLLNTQFGLILADTSIAVPFSVFMLRSYFYTLPEQLEEAAMIDGCTRLQAFYRVILPLSIPGIFATAVYCFLLVWGEFLFAVILTDTETARTVTVGLYTFIGQYMIQWNYLMAAVTVVTIPVVGLFIWAQRYLVAGLTAGAVKE
jgi:multiple sugar transport system permease protein